MPTSIKIADLLREDLILPDLQAGDGPGVLSELAGLLAARNPGVQQDEVARTLMEREKAGSTAIGEGVAVPHGKIASLDRVIACLGRARGGVDFGAPGGAPTHYFFVLVAPQNASGAHLKALARISRLFKEAEFLKRLKAARTAGELYRAIADEDARR